MESMAHPTESLFVLCPLTSKTQLEESSRSRIIGLHIDENFNVNLLEVAVDYFYNLRNVFSSALV